MKASDKKEATEHFGMRMKSKVKSELEIAAKRVSKDKGLPVTSSSLAGLLIEDGLRRLKEGQFQI